MEWSDLSFRVKLNILEGESTVMFDLLLECDRLVKAVTDGASKEACLKIINENF